MGIMDNLIPGLNLANSLIAMVPKGNRRKAGKALAEQLEGQLGSTVDLIVQFANTIEDPVMKLALMQHAHQLAGMKQLADAIGDILVGEDDVEPGK